MPRSHKAKKHAKKHAKTVKPLTDTSMNNEASEKQILPGQTVSFHFAEGKDEDASIASVNPDGSFTVKTQDGQSHAAAKEGTNVGEFSVKTESGDEQKPAEEPAPETPAEPTEPPKAE